MQFFDPSQRIGQSLAFHLVQKMRNIRRLAVTVWSFLNSCASDNIQLRNRLIAAPMAGITDRPFRTLCYEMGAGLTVSEMMSSNPQVWESDKSRLRMVHIDEPGIRTVQIAGSDPKEMADAARINVESGAQIIDINMGCPAKKVNRKLAGSALLQYPDVVKSILTEVVNAVDVPVTLKIRTGWAPEHRNCEEIAQLAEDCGIQALTISWPVHAPFVQWRS